jgi:hypothetical protein
MVWAGGVVMVWAAARVVRLQAVRRISKFRMVKSIETR